MKLTESIKKQLKEVHVDDFIDDYSQDPYARWMLMHFRLPAFQKIDFGPFMKEHRLYCSWRDKRFSVTGASQLGDVWLVESENPSHSYDYRVAVNECYDWSNSF